MDLCSSFTSPSRNHCIVFFRCVLLIGDTRYATAVLTIDRFVGCVDALDTTLSSADYKNWLRVQDRDVREESSDIRAMLTDVPFTSFCAEVAEFFDPALILLRVADSNAPNVSKMVPGSANVKARMQEVVEREVGDERRAVWEACIERYEVREVDLLQPIHYAGYVCDSEFLGHHQTTIPQCMPGFNDSCAKALPDDTVRQTNAVMGLSAFLHGDGLFGRDAAKAAASRMPGYRWVQMFSAGHPDFQVVQSILLSLFTSQSATERNHKLEAMAKTKTRNRLKSVTADKVVYICANKRLQQKNEAILYQEEHLDWFQAPAGADGVTPSLIAKKAGLHSFTPALLHSSSLALLHSCTFSSPEDEGGRKREGGDVPRDLQAHRFVLHEGADDQEAEVEGRYPEEHG